MAPRPKKSLKAKCPENQAALDRLAEKRASLGDKDRYSFTLKRAMESLQKCAEPVTSHKQAMELKYVGSHCATIICPPTKDPSRKRKKVDSNNNSNSSSPSSVVSARSTASVALKRQKAASLATILEKPTAKEVRYQKAVETAEAWKTAGPLKWRVVLIIDGREVKSDHMQAKCQMSGIPTEERQLPIGDMAWIAQGMRDGDVVAVELMLGTIIERKTTEDLKSSIFGSRYAEQRLRLQYSGLPQVLFLVEGDMNKAIPHCTPETLHTAVWETRLHLGFSIVQTAHMEETVKTLKRMHRRILQRTFPSAFRQEALPTFSEAGVHRRLSVEEQGRRRRRRRLQSLMEMTFEMDPTLPLGMERFITYAELKAKIERDRESGTRTVGSIHLAMLKQVATVSDTKCHAIARLYPTVHKLMEAYHCSSLTEEAKKSLFTEVSTQDGPKVRNIKIGPRSSAELYVAYGVNDEETSKHDDDDEVTVGAAKALSRSAVAALAPVAEISTGDGRENDESSFGGRLDVDLPWSDRKPAAKKTVSLNDDLPQDSSGGEAKNPLFRHNTNFAHRPEKMAAEPHAARQRKKSLNTSLGSLLDSTDDDASLFVTNQPQRAKKAHPNSTASMRLSFELESSTEKKSPPYRTIRRNVPINMDTSSSDDESSQGLGVPLRERMQSPMSQTERAVQMNATSKSAVAASKCTEIIEID